MNGFLTDALLLSVRLLPILVVAPVVVFSRVPLTVRLILTLALAAIMSGALPSSDIKPSVEALFGEFLLGAVMAFGFHAAHAGLDLAGKLIDAQIGLNAAGIFDPGTSNMSGLLAEFLAIAFSLLFIALDFHHALLRVFADLITVIPPGSVTAAALNVSFVSIMTQQFLLAFMLVVPITIGLWLTDASFAMLSRSMPQANVYFLALPVKLAVGVLLLLLTLPLIVQRIPLLFENALRFSASPAGVP